VKTGGDTRTRPWSDPAEIDRFRDARGAVLDRIAAAARRAGRSPDEIELVAVSKTVPAERLRAAVAAGLRVLGENRVQEALQKASSLEGAIWHLVGPLQSNKARRAVGLFDVIEAVDSLDLLRRLDRLAADLRPDRRLPLYLEVNVDRDPDKAGLDPSDLPRLLTALGQPTHVQIEGLMTVGRQVANAEDARPTFRALRELSDRTADRFPALGHGLSMGMTDDFEVAIEEGATVVRVGRALFGSRPGG
jgi:pyridoxal phosphate enzyme (YggS family)